MGIIKLQNVGDAVTWRVKSAETVAGKFGPQVKFENDAGDVLFISEETAGRQLGRIPLDIANCAGETLTFSRSENPKGGAPYWNIQVADVVDRAAPVASKRLQPPGSKPIKGLDDFPEPYASVPGNYPVRQAGMPNIHAPAPTDDDAPEWVTGNDPALQPPTPEERYTGVAPNAAKKMAYISAYLDLLGYVKANAKLTDEVAIQAATATIWIGLKQEGLR